MSKPQEIFIKKNNAMKLYDLKKKFYHKKYREEANEAMEGARSVIQQAKDTVQQVLGKYGENDDCRYQKIKDWTHSPWVVPPFEPYSDEDQYKDYGPYYPYAPATPSVKEDERARGRALRDAERRVTDLQIENERLATQLKSEKSRLKKMAKEIEEEKAALHKAVESVKEKEQELQKRLEELEGVTKALDKQMEERGVSIADEMEQQRIEETLV